MKISAVIPTFNHAAYVCHAVESALAQTRPLDDIVVVDDGSTDETRQLLASFGNRIRYLYQPNRGLSAARNAGIRAATGDWLAFLDADDWWQADKISRQEAALRAAPDAVLCYTAAYGVFQDGRSKLIPATNPEQLWPRLRYRNSITGSGSAVCARKDAIVEAGGFRETLSACEDWDLWIRLAVRHRFIAVSEPLVNIRFLSGSMSASPARMLPNVEKIMESSLLVGLHGWRRSVWRRRIRSWHLMTAAWAASAEDLAGKRRFLSRSILQWPSPFFARGRYLSLLATFVPAGLRRPAFINK